MHTELDILILDEPDGAERMTAALEEAGLYVHARVAQNEREYRRQMDPLVEVILADPSRPGTPPVLRLLERQRVRVPVILVSERFDDTEPSELVRDYLPKAHLDRLGGVVRRVLQEEESERERRMLQSRMRLRDVQRPVAPFKERR